MPEVDVAEAAATLGVHIETVRRRIRRGQLQARRDEQGRYLVELQSVDDTTRHDSNRRQHADNSAISARERELLSLLHESQSALEREQVANAELRRLLGNAQLRLQAPSKGESDSPLEQEEPRRRWWQRLAWP